MVCPKEEDFYVCIMMDNVGECVVYRCLKESIGIDIEFIPQDIVKLVLKWCCNCFVHLLCQDTAIHWKIELEELL